MFYNFWIFQSLWKSLFWKNDIICTLLVWNIWYIPFVWQTHTIHTIFPPVWLEYASIRVEAQLFATYFPCCMYPRFLFLLAYSHLLSCNNITYNCINFRMHICVRSITKINPFLELIAIIQSSNLLFVGNTLNNYITHKFVSRNFTFTYYERCF